MLEQDTNSRSQIDNYIEIGELAAQLSFLNFGHLISSLQTDTTTKKTEREKHYVDSHTHCLLG